MSNSISLSIKPTKCFPKFSDLCHPQKNISVSFPLIDFSEAISALFSSINIMRIALFPASLNDLLQKSNDYCDSFWIIAIENGIVLFSPLIPILAQIGKLNLFTFYVESSYAISPN